MKAMKNGDVFDISTIPMPTKSIINAIATPLAETIEYRVATTAKKRGKNHRAPAADPVVDGCVLWSKSITAYAVMIGSTANLIQLGLRKTRGFLANAYVTAGNCHFKEEAKTPNGHAMGPIYDEAADAIVEMVRSLVKAEPSILGKKALASAVGMRALAIYLLDLSKVFHFVIGLNGGDFGPFEGAENLVKLA